MKGRSIFYYSSSHGHRFFFCLTLFFTSFLQMQIRKFDFRVKAVTLPARALEVTEPFSMTQTGRLLMASFITSSNDSIHSILDQFNVKPHEISQCAENEVSASMQPSNSDVVLHLNTNLTSYQSHQLPVGPITVAYKSCVVNHYCFNTELLIWRASKRCRLDYQQNLITSKSLIVLKCCIIVVD